MRRLGVLTLLCVVMTIPAAFAGGPGSSDTPISIRLLTNKEIYAPGEPVEIELQASNNANGEITLNFPDGHQQDYCIDGVYFWSKDKSFTESLSSVDIPAGGTHSWTFVHTSEDYYLTPGTHVIVGTVVGYGQSKPVPIVVGGEQKLEVTVSTEKEVYSVGEEIPIAVKITNHSESEVVLEFRTGRHAGYMIDTYTQFDGSDLTDEYSEIPLGPGESHQWDFVHDPQDYPLTPGRHPLVGIVVGYGRSQPITVVVGPHLQMGVQTDKEVYEQDQDVRIFVVAKNTGDEPITLKFNSSLQANYIIDRVYDWSKDKYFFMVFTTVTIEPGESHTWEFTHTPADYRLLPGEHVIEGVLVGYGLSAATKIVVAGGESPVAVSVATDKAEYELGEPIKIDVTATNPSEEPVTLYFPTLHQADYRIDNAYLWSKGKFFLPIATSVTIPGGGQMTWHFIHTARDFRLLPGEHSIVGIVVGYGESEPVTVAVKETEPAEIVARGLLLRDMPPWLKDGTYGGYPGYFLYTGDPDKLYCLFPGNIDLDPHVNKTVEVTGNYVYTLLPVPGIPLGVTSIRDLLQVEVQTDKAEYYQKEDIEITVIAHNVTEDPNAETLTLHIDPFWDVAAWLDNVRIPNVDGIMAPDRPYVPVPIEIPPGDTAEWKLVYSGEQRPLSPGEHSVVGEVVGYGTSGWLAIKVIEKPSEKIVAKGIVAELNDGVSTNSSGWDPRYVLLDRESGEKLYILRNPNISFGQYVGQYVQVIGVLGEEINYKDMTLNAEEVIPELFVLSIRRLLAVAVSTDKIIYDPGDTVEVYVTAKNCTPEEMVLTFSSEHQAYYRIYADSTADGSTGEGGEGSEIIIEPYGLHVWKFEHTWGDDFSPDAGSYSVVGGVYGYGESKPVVITLKEDPPEIVRAKGIIENFWWYKWIEPLPQSDLLPEPWPWIYACRYVLFDPGEKKILYFLSSARVELDWYVGRCVEVTGYPAEAIVIDDSTLGGEGGENGGDPGQSLPPFMPPDIWPEVTQQLNVVSVLPSEDCPVLDEDENGLPDAWEVITGLRGLGADKSEDSDGDGVPNDVEFYCGTDPLDPVSVVSVKTEMNGAGMVVLRWATVLGRTYSVYCADGPHAGELKWQPLVRGIEGTGGDAEWTDDGTSDVPPSNAAGLKCRFYRVMVE
jgi:hypothetical protein